MRRISPVINDLQVLELIIDNSEITRTMICEVLNTTKAEVKKIEKLLVKNQHLEIITNIFDTRRLIYTPTVDGIMYYDKERGITN